jgi:hypothetical protein
MKPRARLSVESLEGRRVRTRMMLSNDLAAPTADLELSRPTHTELPG